MEGESLRLTIGPLRYQLIAHDEWGLKMLLRLRTGVDCVGFCGPADRTFHLLEFRPTDEERQEISAHAVPQRLARMLPASVPRQGWRLSDDDAGSCCWWHEKTAHSLWTEGIITSHYEYAYQLPWHPILEDIVKLAGGLMHSGLAVLADQGYLFTAPPGGGKTSALSRMQEPWEVWSDDALLIWAAAATGFHASPLPTWGVLTGRSHPMPRIDACRVSAAAKVAGIVIVKKATHDRLTPLLPIEASRHLYRALCEHPRVVWRRHLFRRRLFHTACGLAKAVPCWRAELTRHGNCGELLLEASASGQA